MSDPLGSHVDGATRAFLSTDAAALAEVVVELVMRRTTKFDHCIVGTDTKAIVAFEAIAA
jgi:hypothetical protein